MKLTAQEQGQYDYLWNCKLNSSTYMTQEQQDDFATLNAKLLHKKCPNPHCTGYQGSEDEYQCKKCNTELIDNDGQF